MTERILNAIPGSGLHVQTLYVTESIKFTAGGIEPKFRITANIGSPTGNEVHLIRRSFSTDIDRRYKKGLYFKNWLEFKRVGLPVVGSVREIEDGDILVTDLKADGSEIYGKGLLQSLIMRDDDPNPRRNKSIDPIFKTIMRTNHIILREEINHLVTLATKEGIMLSSDSDAFELLVHPNGAWQLVTLDLHSAEIHQDNTNGNLGKTNLRLGNEFFSYLQTLSHML